MGYDYIVTVGAKTDDITSAILKELKKADGSKVRIKCDDTEINRVLGQLSKIDSKYASRIQIDVNGSDVTKTLDQVRKEAHNRIEEIKRELSGMNLNSLNSELSNAEKRLADKKNELNKRTRDTLKNTIDTFNLGSDVNSDAYKNKAKDLLNYVETYKKAGGELGNLSANMQATIKQLQDGGMSGKPFSGLFSGIEREIGSINTEINNLKGKIETYNNLKKELDGYNTFLDVGGTGSGTGTGGMSVADEQIQQVINDLSTLSQKISEIRNAFGTVDDANGFQSLITSINNISTAMTGIKSVISDVGDGQEFSPLLSMINDITTAINQLKDAVSKIKLNLNIDTNLSNEASNLKIEGRKQDLLTAYKEQFAAMKAYEAGNKKIVQSMFGSKANSTLISELNKSILQFDESGFDNIEQKIKAYETLINRMKEVSKLQYGTDIYKDMDSRYGKSVSTAKANLTRASNAANKALENDMGGLFGKTDLSGVTSQLEAIVSKLNEIASAAKTVSESLKLNISFDSISAGIKKEEGIVNEVVSNESGKLDTLKQKVIDVTTAVDNKSKAFTNEQTAVSSAVNAEIQKLQELINKLQEVGKAVETLGNIPISINMDEKSNVAMENLKTILGGIDNSDLTTLSTALSGLKISKANVNNMQKFANAILTLKTNLNNLGGGGKEFLASIDNLVTNRGEELKALAVALKATRSEIEKTKGATGTTTKEDKKAKNDAIKTSYDKEIRLLGEINKLEIQNKNASNETKRVNEERISQIKAEIEAERELRKEKGWTSDKEQERVNKESSKLQTKLDNTANKQFIDTVNEAIKVEKELQTLTAKEKSGVITSGEKERLQQLIAERQRLNEEIQKTTELTAKETAKRDELYNLTSSKSIEKDKSAQYANSINANKNATAITNAANQLQAIKDRGLVGLDEEIALAEKKIQDLNAEFLRGSKTLEQYEAGVRKALSSFDNTLGKNMTKEQGIFALKNRVKELVTELNGTNLNIKGIDTATNGMVKLTYSFTNADGEAQDMISTLTLLDGKMKTTANTANSTNVIGNAFASWEKGIKNALRYLTSFVGVYRIFYAIKQGINTVIDFNTALTEMRKVSDESVESLMNFQSESFGLADGVGTTALQIQKSTAEFMRLGETMDEAKESAQVANILMNVSEFDSIDAATESLIAMKAAYDELDQVTIVDKLNLIG